VIRLPQYVKRIRAGGINVNPQIKVVQDKAAMAVVDGDNGMGHLVVSHAVELAIKKARDAGVAWVGTRNSNHAGPASLYARMPIEHDMIGLYFAVGNANHLPPWGGMDMLLSTNPIAAGIPAGSEPAVVLDMATTVAAYGKVKAKAKRGETMPEGWMIDRQGKPLTDPKRAEEGFLLPIGGHKGYGLALIVGLLAGTLQGAGTVQADVLNLLAEGRSTKDIARRLGLAVPTVKTHLAAVYRQLGAHNRLQAVVKASALTAPPAPAVPAPIVPAMVRGLSQTELFERTFATI
jgi:LDH2 family malate/lactate/ureidoglycolate dehydrogenase